jgi:hypothetical protein
MCASVKNTLERGDCALGVEVRVRPARVLYVRFMLWLKASRDIEPHVHLLVVVVVVVVVMESLFSDHAYDGTTRR